MDLILAFLNIKFIVFDGADHAIPILFYSVIVLPSIIGVVVLEHEELWLSISCYVLDTFYFF